MSVVLYLPSFHCMAKDRGNMCPSNEFGNLNAYTLEDPFQAFANEGFTSLEGEDAYN
jgi:hypothetical protein